MAQYQLNGQLVCEHDPFFQQALQAAYAAKQRPLCACKNPPTVEMYLSRIGSDQILVKRMPGSGAGHAPECDHYQPPAELSGRGELQANAIVEDEASGKTALKLGFSLSKTSTTRSITGGGGTAASEVKTDPKKLGLRATLHYLWDEAGLNRWSPAMSGKRNWYVIRHHLLSAAAKTTTKKMSLADILLIPEPFRPDDKAGITARRRQFLGKFTQNGSSQPIGIAVGELKSLDEARFGYKLTLKHQPDAPLFMAEVVVKRLEKAFSRELAIWREDNTAHVLVASTFTLSASGNLNVEGITLMTCDANWLPFDGHDEYRLIEQLTAEKRRFIVGLRYNLAPGDVIATCLLTDTGDTPTALYIDPFEDEESPEYTETLARVIAESAFASVIWKPLQGEVLRLPPAQHASMNNGYIL